MLVLCRSLIFSTLFFSYDAALVSPLPFLGEGAEPCTGFY